MCRKAPDWAMVEAMVRDVPKMSIKSPPRQPSTTFGSSTFVRGPTSSFGGSFSPGTFSPGTSSFSTFSAGTPGSQDPLFFSGTSPPGNVLPTPFDQQAQQPSAGLFGQIVKGVNKWLKCPIAGVSC